MRGSERPVGVHLAAPRLPVQSPLAPGTRTIKSGNGLPPTCARLGGSRGLSVLPSPLMELSRCLLRPPPTPRLSRGVFLEELALTLGGAVWLGEMLQTMSRMPAALVHGVFRATHADVLPLCSIHRQARSFSCDSFLRRLSREGPQDPKSRRYLRQNAHHVSILVTLQPEIKPACFFACFLRKPKTRPNR